MTYGLQLLDKVDELYKKYKGIWDEIDRVRNGFLEQNLTWDTSKCYVPYLIPDYIFNNAFKPLIANLDNYEIDLDIMWLTYLASWRRSKQVFNFEKSVAESIIREYSGFDLNITATPDMFGTLPYSNFFVHYPMHFENLGSSEGFFVSWDYDYRGTKVAESIKNMQLFLSLTFIIEDEPLQFRVFFNDLSFRRLIQRCNVDWKRILLYKLKNSETAEQLTQDKFEEYAAKMQVSNRDNLNKALKLVLYINEQGKRTPHIAKKNKADVFVSEPKLPKVEEMQNEVQNWEVNSEGIQWVQFAKEKLIDVSLDTSESLVSERNTPAEYKKGTPKSAHTRKGHIMRYWVGSKRKPEERRLVEKWVPEKEINVKSEDDIIITNNEII